VITLYTHIDDDYYIVYFLIVYFDFTTCRRGAAALSAAAYIDVPSTFYSILAIIFCNHFDSRIYIYNIL